MNKKQRKEHLFARCYLANGLNATEAAKEAGFSARSAHVTACRLLKKANVKAILSELSEKKAKKLDLKAEDVLAELCKMGFANLMDYVTIGVDGQADVDLSKLTRDQAAAIQEITVDTTGGSGDGERRQVLRTKFKLGDKRGSLELLGKHLKLFTDKTEISGSMSLTTPITDVQARIAELTAKRADNRSRGA